MPLACLPSLLRRSSFGYEDRELRHRHGGLFQHSQNLTIASNRSARPKTKPDEYHHLLRKALGWKQTVPCLFPPEAEKRGRELRAPHKYELLSNGLRYTMSCFSRITGIKDVRQAGTLILKEDAMNGCRLLLSHIRTVCPTIHLTRLRALLTAVETATQQHRLTLTDLGRVLKSPALVKHNITRMDRLLGNGRLSAERTGLYTVVTQWILVQVTAPLVLVDWSTLT